MGYDDVPPVLIPGVPNTDKRSAATAVLGLGVIMMFPDVCDTGTLTEISLGCTPSAKFKFGAR